jgi:hypothetical protein
MFGLHGKEREQLQCQEGREKLTEAQNNQSECEGEHVTGQQTNKKPSSEGFC